MCAAAEYSSVAAAVLLVAAPSLHAQELGQAAISTTYEQITLSDKESMGQVGVGLSKQVNKNLSLGVASYAAVRGERGGFITLGMTGEGRWPLGAGWTAETGAFVGAGGGRGSFTLSGGGLMLRAHTGVGFDLTSVGLAGRLSAGVSHVNFPNGSISSTQPYLSYELPFSVLMRSGWDTASEIAYSPELATKLSPHTHELSLVKRNFKVAHGALNDSGSQQANFGLLGIEWHTELGPYTYARFETEGALGGGATGYMQILGGVGLKVPLTDRLSALASVSVGAGGGGGVDAGGGLLIDTGLGLQFNLSPRWFAEASVQNLRATSGSFKANSAAFKVGYRFGPGAVQGNPTAFAAHALRIRAAHQSYIQASPDWRSSHADQGVQNLGVQMDVFLSPRLYLTGQGLAAWKGDAGAYMTGQVGVGGAVSLSEKISAELEVLIGAAGGGGLQMGSGLVAQGNAGLVWQASDALSLHASAGYLRALNGPFRAKVVGLALGYRFTGYSAK
jgi:hypothetical protein